MENRVRLSNLEALKAKIVNCERCPRLRQYCAAVAERKKRQFLDWEYWGRPLPGFGDPLAKILIVGLAPAAHGGLRTGRMFCGDASGSWLARALYETGFANQPTSTSRDDGLKLEGAYVTAVVRCAPPDNRPLRQEIGSCLPYLCRELELLGEVKVVLVLGRIAFDGYFEALHMMEHPSVPKPRFAHGARQELGGGLPTLLVSYHPSRQNTQTGRLRWDQWLAVFMTARMLVGKRRDLASSGRSGPPDAITDSARRRIF
jgi:uracil-DNA glycosylase family 4